MKSIKFLLLACIMTVASASWAKLILVDKTLLKSLDGHKSLVTQLDLPPGRTTITVVAEENAVISCQFVNSSGVVGLEQNNVSKCWGNVPLQNSQDTMTVKVTNETDSLVDLRIHQITSSDK